MNARLNIIFDLGAVVFHWQPRRLLSRHLPDQTVSAEETDRLADLFFQNYSGSWGEFDRGTIEIPALAAAIAARTGLSNDEVLRVVDGVPGELLPIDATVSLLEELKAAGQRLFYLSNMPKPYATHLKASYPLFDLFDDGIFSSHVSLSKPDPAIFRHAESQFGVAASTCIFLDDNADNIEAAKAAGWQAVLFTDAAQARSELHALGAI